MLRKNREKFRTNKGQIREKIKNILCTNLGSDVKVYVWSKIIYRFKYIVVNQLLDILSID
ncbi:hypothetical protein DVW12_10030 [Clostridium botulinum]|nr:hypothetical protein [Clostridium botulinum]